MIMSEAERLQLEKALEDMLSYTPKYLHVPDAEQMEVIVQKQQAKIAANVENNNAFYKKLTLRKRK